MKRCNVILVLQFLFVGHIKSWDDGSVLLRDVQALTLYKDRYTTARRSSPVPQLQCVGGSAGCQAFVPEVVQCQNKGWDGEDVQWECKTDMDNAYRFGRMEVSCEGYRNPADALILKGSCGLEYTLELTEHGRRTSHAGTKSFGALSLETTNATRLASRVVKANLQPVGTPEVCWWLLCSCSWHTAYTSCSSAGTRPPGGRAMDRQVTPGIIAMAPLQHHRPRDSNPTSQAILVPTQATVSIVTTLTGNSTQEAMLLLAQVGASGPAWEQEECWDISLVVIETSPTTMIAPLTTDLLLLEATHLPLGHALLPVLEELKEDESCGGGQLINTE
ncbi:store-operated calcium entry-associated regulatory factor isoform X1 [Pungitius pungitius]|uniref:store-operated calcium entry-associated regulatory factor isoform X1 n=1 Tax=Pungitius pungitius TaxID=134920 RepID=UPI001887C5E4|nr:store-operated calcium entry-associated regulatory factor isoform X1 [Pungitius pungitius]